MLTVLRIPFYVISSFNLSLAVGKSARINLSQAASCKHFQGQNRCFSVFETGYWKDFQNKQEISKKQAKTLSLIFSSTMQKKIVKTSAHMQKVLFIIINPKTSFLKVHKIENFLGSEFEFCVISMLVMLKY